MQTASSRFLNFKLHVSVYSVTVINVGNGFDKTILDPRRNCLRFTSYLGKTWIHFILLTISYGKTGLFDMATDLKEGKLDSNHLYST